jgi:putative ABC transport system ATP-binding protein
MTDLPSIVARHIARSFITGKTRIHVIRELSLGIYPGELTLIVGPSGSGKSTLLALLSGLLRPDAGTVTALNQDIWALQDAAIDHFRLMNCGFIFQGFNLFQALTALEQVLLPMKYVGIVGEAAQQHAQAALAEVGLSQRMQLRPIELSGGEKQRVAIARAIVKQPKLLFADEPTSALDSKNGQIVIDILHRIARSHGATVLGVTHDPRLLKYADRVLYLEDGQILRDERVQTKHKPYDHAEKKDSKPVVVSGS